MRSLLPLLFLCAAFAAEEPKQLDPTKPEDALQIIHILTQEVSMPRKNADAFMVALQTLAKVVSEQKAAATPPPAKKD